jgi:serine/threonine-protein kinase
MIDRTLGRYRLVELLGRGGMGSVYRAEDPRLGRDVAIKLLRDDALRDERARQRLRDEARALSRLVHPGIATLFDFDRDEAHDFLVMEFVPGETLAATLAAGPLPETRARTIALEVADALRAAHEQGLVHRDLKPANIVITPRGRAKVLDFGLVRVLDDTAVEGLSQAQTVSSPGAIAGTLAYMAPEQVRGERADARTDLHALGLLLFEMIAGRRAFGADNVAALVYEIAHAPPPRLADARPGVSADLDRVVARCLEKDPGRRFPDAATLVRALRGETAASEAAAVAMPHAPAPRAAGQSIGSIAVLPFANRSGDPAQEFFADGMTDALITDLARIGALRVISRTSAMRFKGVDRPLPEIARELGVDAVVEGSAMFAGGRVRITVQLVEAATDRSLWAERYDRDLDDVLDLQGDVTRAIAEEIRVKLRPEERARLRTRRVVDANAHLAYLQGRYLWNRWTPESLRESLEHYERALSLDPSFALAYAGLADSYSILANINAMPQAETYERAREAATRGLALDDTVAELHVSLAYVLRFLDWNWPAAERAFLKALDLNPGYATGRRWYAQFLSGMGRFDEAIAEADHALVLDPLSLIIHGAVGDVHYYARRYERAIAYYRRSLEIDPAFHPGLTDLSRVLDQVGQSEEALEVYLRAAGDTVEPAPSTGLATLLARAGRLDEAQAMMNALLSPRAGTGVRPRFTPFGVAAYYAVVRDVPRALDWLERAHAERDGTLVWIKVHPRLDPLRGEPRFRALLEKMRLD